MTLRFRNSWVPWIGFAMALSLRLWHLGTPPQLVSDEVFFVTDGWSYVTHQTYFDPHPPLGKLVLGVTMKFFGHEPAVWRSVNAVEGALIIPLLWWIVWRLSKRYAAANIVVALALVDGLMLVDSRLGLINIPYVLASLLAVACMLRALPSRRPGGWLWLCGTCIGLALATKWLSLMVTVPVISLWLWPMFFGQEKNPDHSHWTRRIATIALVVWPLLLYWLVFVIHFRWLGISNTFFSTNVRMLNYHLSVPALGDPNRQPWWGWLLAWRPFPYWSTTSNGHTSVIMSLPNPWVWWTGVGVFLYNLIRGWRDRLMRLLNVLLLCAWLPFALIQRIMYSYHAMVFDVWLMVLLAIWLGRHWNHHRRFVVVYLIIAAVTFVWFAPWYLNISLTTQQFHLRQWLPTWTTV